MSHTTHTTHTTTAADLKHEIQKNLKQLRAMAEDVRVRLHLAGMDAKEEWDKLEPRLAEVERTAGEFTEATRNAASELVKRLTKLKSKLG